MTPEEITVSMIDALNAEGVPYMLVGSFSSNFYSIPRATQAADFVIPMKSGVISSLADRLAPDLQLDRQLSFETVTATKKCVFLAANNPFYIELFQLSDDAHDCERFARRRRVAFLGRETYIPTKEDVIVTKLRWSLAGKRAKDIDDVKNIIAVQEGSIDWDYVNRWCDNHMTRTILDEIRS